MNYVEKLFDQVQSSLNLNAATLSGAIDILVIPQLDGSLKCTPFHVRFGKLQLISSSEKVVSIYVNGVKTDLQMKLGHAGEAFFVEETVEPVPSILATSPITSPKPGRVNKQSTEELVTEFMSSRLIPNQQQQHITSTSSTTTTISSSNILVNSNNSSNNTLVSSVNTNKTLTTNGKNIQTKPDQIKETKSLTEALEQKIIESEKKKINEEILINIESPIGSFVVQSEPEIIPKISSVGKAIETSSNEVASDSETELKQWRWGGLPKFIRRKKSNTNTTTTSNNNNNSNSTSSTINTNIEDNQESDNNNILENGNGIIEISSPLSSSSSLLSSSDDFITPTSSSLENQPQGGWTRSLLKMFNKKEPAMVSTTTINSNNTTITQTSSSSNGNSAVTMTTTTTHTTINSTNGIESPSYLVKQNPPITSPAFKESSPRVNNIIDGGEIFLLDEEQEEQDQQQLQTNSNADPLNSTYASMVKQQEQEHEHEQQQHLNVNYNCISDSKSPINISPLLSNNNNNTTPKLNDLKEFPPLSSNNNNKKRHSMTNLMSLPIQLSLCGHLIQDKNLQNEPEEKESFFKEYLISFEQFSNDLSLLKNPHLVAKIGDHYYPWIVASHLILSQLIYNKPLPLESIDQLKSIDKEERVQVNLLNQSASSSILSSSSNSNISNVNGHMGINSPSGGNGGIQQPTTKSSWKWWWKSNNNNNNNNQHDHKNNLQLPPSSSPINVPNNNQYVEHRTFTKKSLRPTSEQLSALGLKKGANRITFSVSSTLQGTREVSASIYFWDNNSKIVISDIDGTITKSDVFGQVLPLIGKDWSHFGVAELYSNIKENGYQVIYLTSRAIGQAALTRTYISSVKQTGSTGVTTSNASISIPSQVLIQASQPINNTPNISNNPNLINNTVNNNNNNNINNLNSSSTISDNNNTTVITTNNSNLSGGTILQGNNPTMGGNSNIVSTAIPTLSHFKLPEGPVFMSPNRLLSSLNREVIKRNPEEFKIACLQDIQNIFPSGTTPFYAGFGNRNTDTIAYNAVGVPKGKTFTINPYGVINTTNTTYNKTYTKLNDLVQDMFPCQSLTRHSVDEQYNEYHYWKKSIIPLSQLDPI